MKIDDKFVTQILGDARGGAFKAGVRFINYEMIPGDILEFGCYTGRSLACLTHHHQQYQEIENSHNSQSSPIRMVYGFDSFEGLQSGEGHPRWDTGLFSTNHSFHPTIPEGADVTPEAVLSFFSHYGLQIPIIQEGCFDQLDLDGVSQVALVHIDCDLYSSTKVALELIKDKLQVGSLIYFDDWFLYRGRRDKGERRAFSEFLEENPEISCEEFLRYAAACKAFIVTGV